MQGRVTIIICTRNRADSLRETLKSIGKTYVPSGWEVELLVVDNCSTDHTQAVFHEGAVTNMPARLVSEGRPGKGYAYNTGIRNALHDVLLFTDDDVRVPNHWLEGMCLPILLNQADAVGGGVHFPEEYRELFLSEPLRSRQEWFASTSGLDPHRLDRMVGANMAFHRKVAEQIGGFDPALGPGALGFADETLFSRQLLAAGFRLASALDVSVEHRFDLTRLSPRQVVEIATRMGRSEGYLVHHWERQPIPSLLQLWQAKLGLGLRKFLRPDLLRSKKSREWELIRTERTAVVEMRYSLRHETPKYQQSTALSQPRVDVSIIIATRNRAPALAETLASLAETTVPEHLVVEVILIDNGSTDATPDVIATFHPPHLRVRSMTETVGGKSHALNAAVACAQGEVLLFTDDDVRVPSDWISRMCEPIRYGGCDAAVGGIVPGPGRDLGEMFLTPAVFDPVGCSRPILIGANMALHRRISGVVGKFDIELGPGAIGMGEDTDFSYRVEQHGFRIAAIKDASVEHFFDVDRCGDDEQRNMARKLGRSGAYMDYHLHRKPAGTTWIDTLKSWWWLVRLRLRRARQGASRHPLTGWELHQLAAVAYLGEQLKQRLHAKPKYANMGGAL